MKPNVELHIEELVLHGFAPGDRAGIAQAVEAELTRLLAQSALSQEADVARLDGGSFQVAPGAKPQAIGTQVARAIVGGMHQ